MLGDESDAQLPSTAGAGAGLGAADVVVVEAPGSPLGWPGAVVVPGWVVVVVGPVLVEALSELGGVVLAGVVEVVTGTLEVASVHAAVPAAPTVGVVDCASTVASVWVWVRPGGGAAGVGFAAFAAGVLAVVGVVCLTGGAALCAVLVVLAGVGGLCAFLTATWRCTTRWTTTGGGAGAGADATAV